MQNVQTIDNQAVTGSFTVDVTKGTRDGRVSQQWANRPDDQKFLSLYDMKDAIEYRTKQSREESVKFDDCRVTHEDGLRLQFPGINKPVEFTNWSFGQLCALTKTPASYMRQLPRKLAAINLQYGLMNNGDELKNAYVRENGITELRSMNSQEYGRIFDYEVLQQVIRIAGNGTGETKWKVPGMLDWSTNANGLVQYNPFVDVTKETTTLYASDRDMYVFLVDDTHPIEVGKLRNGQPDLMFRGFIVWNSETGSKTFGMSTMLLRGVCCNRNLWGVGETRELKIRHTRLAPDRFAFQASPMLEHYANMPAMPIIAKVQEAKATIVAKNDDDRISFLTKKVGLSKSVTDKVLAAVLNEEETKAESIFDMVQGMTAYARTIQHQDARLAMEEKAGRLMDGIKV